MERDISHRAAGGRTLHSYTPRSHEDLLRSHIHLDNDKQTRLNNDIKRYKGENESLRRDFDRIQRDLKSKDEEIRALQDELRNKPEHDHPDSPAFVFEVDGKAATLDELIDHFNGVIQRHHDLIDKKTQEINDLEALLGPRQHHRPRRDEGTQSVRQRSSREIKEHLMNDFAQQLSEVRKESEIVQNILTDRNTKLEKIVEELQNKLVQNEKEIQHLRGGLPKKQHNKLQSESLIHLVMEKERENEILRKIVLSLQCQGPPVQRKIILDQESGCKDLEYAIKKIIENKKNAINKLNKIISDFQKEPSNVKAGRTPDTYEVEKDCKKMIAELNNMIKQLYNILKIIKISNPFYQKEKNLGKLEKLKKQCRDEVDALQNEIGSRGTDDVVTMKGQTVLTIDDPNSMIRIVSPIHSKENDILLGTIKEPVEEPSHVKINFSPQENPQLLETEIPGPTKPFENSSVISQISYKHRTHTRTHTNIQLTRDSLKSSPFPDSHMPYQKIVSIEPPQKHFRYLSPIENKPLKPKEKNSVSSYLSRAHKAHVSTQTKIQSKEETSKSTHLSYTNRPYPETISTKPLQKHYPSVPCEACGSQHVQTQSRRISVEKQPSPQKIVEKQITVPEKVRDSSEQTKTQKSYRSKSRGKRCSRGSESSKSKQKAYSSEEELKVHNPQENKRKLIRLIKV